MISLLIGNLFGRMLVPARLSGEDLAETKEFLGIFADRLLPMWSLRVWLSFRPSERLVTA